MRKRSGALHSDSEEEFTQLAELSHGTNGYFYDDALHTRLSKHLNSNNPPPLSKRTSKPRSNPTSTHFEGFDFAAEDYERQEEQRELQAVNKAKVVNFTIICTDHVRMRLQLRVLWPQPPSDECESLERRGIDLFVLQTPANHNNLNKSTHCFKFWVLEAGLVGNPLYDSYLNKASRVLNFSGKGEVGESYPFEDLAGVLVEAVRNHTQS